MIKVLILIEDASTFCMSNFLVITFWIMLYIQHTMYTVETKFFWCLRLFGENMVWIWFKIKRRWIMDYLSVFTYAFKGLLMSEFAGQTYSCEGHDEQLVFAKKIVYFLERFKDQKKKADEKNNSIFVFCFNRVSFVFIFFAGWYWSFWSSRSLSGDHRTRYGK